MKAACGFKYQTGSRIMLLFEEGLGTFSFQFPFFLPFSLLLKYPILFSLVSFPYSYPGVPPAQNSTTKDTSTPPSSEGDTRIFWARQP